MDLSDIESFHYLYRSLWQPETNAKRHSLNIMDTIIFQHGQPFRWIFTSEKTGEILKKKECKLTAGEIVNALKKRAGKLRGKKIIHNERSKFACVWYRTETGLMAFRLLDEAELYFILGDRTYTQFISAIQVYFSGYPLKGCGIFEHHYLDSRGSKPVHRTFEFVHMPQSIDIFDLNHQVGEVGAPMPMKDIVSDFRPSQTLSDAPSVKQERLNILETQHEILKLQTGKLMKLIEKTVQCRVTTAVFLYYFNTSWTPFVVACTKMQLESKGATIPGMVGEADPGPSKPTAAGEREITAVDRTTTNLKADLEKTDLHVGKSPEKKQQPKKLVRTSTEIYSTAKDWEVRKGIAEEIARDEESYAHAPPSEAPVAATAGPFIPPPNSSMPRSRINYEDEEARPFRAAAAPADRKKQLLHSTFGGKRHSVLDNFIQVVPGKLSHAAGAGDKKGAGASRRAPSSGRRGIQNDLSDKRFTAPTDNNCVRVKIDADKVRRSDDERWTFVRKGESRRPISAPHTAQARRRPLDSSKSSFFHLSAGVQSSNLPKGEHCTAGGSTRASGIQKRPPLASEVCFGDYCNLLTPLAITLDDTDEYLQSTNMMKSTGADGVVRLKCTKPEYQISCKTVLLGRAENKYIGGEVSVGENIESYEYSEEDVINACAKQHIVKVAEKCRKEAFSGLIRGGLDRVPTMSNMQATAFTYRNAIYNDALSQVHPSRFYYTVPACKVCSLLYTALDRVRESVIHRPISSRLTTRQLDFQDGDDPGADIVKKAREALRERADACRSPRDAKMSMERGESRRMLGKSLPDGYADEDIYEDLSPEVGRGAGTVHVTEYDDDTVNKLETCVEGDENSTIVSPQSPRPGKAAMQRVDMNDDRWEHNTRAARPKSANAAVKKKSIAPPSPSVPRMLPEGASAECTRRIRIARPIIRTHSVGGDELSAVDLEVARRKTELLGGHHLGGEYRGANEPVTRNTASTQEFIRTLAGSKSNGSLSSWLDLMSAAKNKGRASSEGFRGRDTHLPPSHTLRDTTGADREVAIRNKETERQMSWSAKRATMTSPEALLRRQDVMDFRRTDRTQWHDSLRDESLSPTPETRRKRPTNAAPTASGVKVEDGVVVYDRKRPPFAVRSGEDLKAINGTFLDVGRGKVRPKSAGAIALRKTKPLREPPGEYNIDESPSAAYTSSQEGDEGGETIGGLYLNDSDRERLCKLREEILLERNGYSGDGNAAARGGRIAASPSRRVVEVAHTLSKSEYSYGHVPFTDAQCLPYRGRGQTNSSDGDFSADIERGERSGTLGQFESGTLSDVTPREIPRVLPVSGNLKNSAKNKRSKQ